MAEHKLQKEQLSKLLQQLPDRTPPTTLVSQIVESVNRSEVQYRQDEKRSFFSFSLRNMLLPRQLAMTFCSLVLAFWLGFSIGEKKQTVPLQPVPLQLAGYVYQNAEAGLLLGRALLAAGKEAEALAILQNASALSPNNPEHLFWLGTAHWYMGNTELEQQSYRRAIHAAPDYLPALVNLGHNLLENNESEEALQTYNRVLTISPGHKVALYNSALAIHLTEESNQAIRAWKRYLHAYRSGKWAQLAVQHLNALGDFSYRAYQIGVRQIILHQEALLGTEANKQRVEVEQLAEIYRQAPVSQLNLSLFYAGNETEARMQAITLKHLLNNSLQDHNKHIQISWFAEAESIQTTSGIKRLPHGLLISGQLQLSQVQGESI